MIATLNSFMHYVEEKERLREEKERSEKVEREEKERLREEKERAEKVEREEKERLREEKERAEKVERKEEINSILSTFQSVGEKVKGQCLRIDECDRKIEDLSSQIESGKEVTKKEVNKLVTKEVKRIEEKVLALESEKAEKERRLEAEISKVTERVRRVEQMGSATAIATTAIPNEALAMPSFRGNSHENPITFIKEVEDYLTLLSCPLSHRSRLFLNMFRDRAKVWAQIMKYPQREYDELKAKFLERYWNVGAKFRFRQNVLQGSFQVGTKGSMEEYALRKIAAASNCEPPIGEEELIYMLIRQFPIRIQHVLWGAKVNTQEALLELLINLDSVNEEERRQAPSTGGQHRVTGAINMRGGRNVWSQNTHSERDTRPQGMTRGKEQRETLNPLPLPNFSHPPPSTNMTSFRSEGVAEGGSNTTRPAQGNRDTESLNF
jgi:hypothetical protein